MSISEGLMCSQSAPYLGFTIWNWYSFWHGTGLIADPPTSDSKLGTTDVTPGGEKGTSENLRPDTSSSQQIQQTRGTDVTDVKVSKVKNFVPHVEDFLDFTSVTSETSGNETGACANDAA